MKGMYILILLILILASSNIGCTDKEKENQEKPMIGITNAHWYFAYNRFINPDYVFFLFNASEGININPEQHSFYIGYWDETVSVLRKFDFNNRTYDERGNPHGGDRNASFDYTADGNKLWNEGEIIAFDRPKKEMNLKVEIGRPYRVLIKNSQEEIIWEADWFIWERGIPLIGGIYWQYVEVNGNYTNFKNSPSSL